MATMWLADLLLLSTCVLSLVWRQVMKMCVALNPFSAAETRQYPTMDMSNKVHVAGHVALPSACGPSSCCVVCCRQPSLCL
jgi:hypothetical protein